jgi:hypothetical protein
MRRYGISGGIEQLVHTLRIACLTVRVYGSFFMQVQSCTSNLAARGGSLLAAQASSLKCAPLVIARMRSIDRLQESALLRLEDEVGVLVQMHDTQR